MALQRFNNRVVRFHFSGKINEAHAGWLEYDTAKKELRMFADNQHVLRFNVLKVVTRPSRSVPSKSRVFFNIEGARPAGQGRLSLKAMPQRIGMLASTDEAFELLTGTYTFDDKLVRRASNSPLQSEVAQEIMAASLRALDTEVYGRIGVPAMTLREWSPAYRTDVVDGPITMHVLDEIDDNFELNAKFNIQRFLDKIGKGYAMDIPSRYSRTHGWEVRKVQGIRPVTGNYILNVFGTERSRKQVATLPLLEFESRSSCRDAAFALQKYFPELLISVCYVSQVVQSGRLIEREVSRRD